MHRAKGNSGGEAVEKGDGEVAEGSVATRRAVHFADARDVLSYVQLHVSLGIVGPNSYTSCVTMGALVTVAIWKGAGTR